MSAGRRELNVPHALTPHLGLGHFNTAFFANHTAVLKPLVFAAKAFVVLDGAKNLGAKQAFALGLERTVVDGFGLLHLTERPRPDFFGRGESDFDGVEMLTWR